MMEEWRDVTGYEGRYMVSNLGRVRRRELVVLRGNHRMRLSERIFEAPTTGPGYPMVNLRKDSRATSYYVHRLVGQHFIGEIPEGCYVHHRDGDRTNNVIGNLEIVTPGENIQAAYDSGKKVAPRGEDNVKSVLTEDEVRFIRQRCIKGSLTHGGRALARQFGVTKSTIQAVVNRQSWQHI